MYFVMCNLCFSGQCRAQKAFHTKFIPSFVASVLFASHSIDTHSFAKKLFLGPEGLLNLTDMRILCKRSAALLSFNESLLICTLPFVIVVPNRSALYSLFSLALRSPTFYLIMLATCKCLTASEPMELTISLCPGTD
ncbi:hypothetical protein ABZP36_000316 [Zizania latifolia]